MLEIKTFYEIAEKKNIPCPDSLDSWPKGIPLNKDKSCSIDLNVLKIVVETFASLGYPILLILTCGTTIG